MIVTIHQPHYLPWLGYLHRMMQADVFVLLDHVQFERGNYQNRTMIRMPPSGPGARAEGRWLTVPVIQRSQKERIADKEVDNRVEGPRWWSTQHFLTLRHAYREARFLGHYLAALQRLYATRYERLVDLNAAALGFLREAFGIRTPLVKSSELDVEGAKGELILDICKALGARALLVGLGGSRGYLDRNAFERAGVRLELQQFTHPVYRQCGAQPGNDAAPFTAGLSALDLLLNHGPHARELLLDATAPRREHAALAAA